MSGLTVGFGAVTVTSRLLLSAISITSSVFFFLYNIQTKDKSS